MSKYRVYIESLNNFPIADWGVSAYQGFKESQISCIFFEDVEEVPASRFNIVVGTIETTNAFFERLGFRSKMSLNIPECLLKYTKRNIEYMTMAQFKLDRRLPIFVKPNGKAKEFVSGVITREDSRASFFNSIPDNCPVLVSEVLDIVTEYRGYVIDGRLEGIYWYTGDFRKFIDCSIVDAAIADYTNAPCGYTIDFGLTRSGETVLIECNDGWSIGNYGLNHTKYAKLLFKRWNEIMINGYNNVAWKHS